MICLVMVTVAGPCSACGEQMAPAHVTDEPAGLFCSKCCPLHRQASIDFETERPGTVEGDQLSLLGD